MPRKTTAEKAALADFTPGVKTDAMQPGDTRIREKKTREYRTQKQGVSEPIVRTDIR